MLFSFFSRPDEEFWWAQKLAQCSVSFWLALIRSITWILFLNCNVTTTTYEPLWIFKPSERGIWKVVSFPSPMGQIHIASPVGMPNSRWDLEVFWNCNYSPEYRNRSVPVYVCMMFWKLDYGFLFCWAPSPLQTPPFPSSILKPQGIFQPKTGNHTSYSCFSYLIMYL